jgi:23S rRNA (guanine745-N1)-methyltransferase
MSRSRGGHDDDSRVTPLACTVHDCRLRLVREDKRYVCPKGHSYDVARSGYVNLLQPGDRRSKSAGDSKASVRTRATLLQRGVGATILNAFVQHAGPLVSGERPTVIELGSGTGDVLGGLQLLRPIDGYGVDLSVAAADYSARRFPALTWIVANADRRLPVVDASAALVLSLHARRNPDECARVLKASGFLVIAVPTADDLIELRQLVRENPVGRDRAPSLTAAFGKGFVLIEQFAVSERHRLDRERLLDLLQATYRGRSSIIGRIEQLSDLEVTLASEIFLFRRR